MGSTGASTKIPLGSPRCKCSGFQVRWVLKKMGQIGTPIFGDHRCIYPCDMVRKTVSIRTYQNVCVEVVRGRFHQCLFGFYGWRRPAIKPVENLDAVQISHEQGQASPARQPIGSGFDASNFKFIFPVFFFFKIRSV